LGAEGVLEIFVRREWLVVPADECEREVPEHPIEIWEIVVVLGLEVVAQF
jgi:hypothetical protein